MNKLPMKMKLIMSVLMVLFMIIYTVLFGDKNAVIGVMMVMAAVMNLGNDLSYKPRVSFIKVLILLLILGISSFLNNPITIFGCILTFIVVFGTTFTSYHLFSVDVYLPYLMCYFMMMCIPISLEDLPMRLLSLVFGAIFIVGLNLLVNRKKEYELTKNMIEKLAGEIIHAVDLKLAGKDVSRESFDVINGFYTNIISKFEYKYFPSPVQESVLNIIKAFQFIGIILSDSTLSEDELHHIKNTVKNISNIKSEDIFNISVKTREMNFVLLNLKIIVNEIQNKDSLKQNIIPDKNIVRGFFKKSFSFRSVKFTFAFKMAFVLTLWEVLTLIFNIPFTKWLYFASIPLMLPYINDVAYTAKTRVMGTFVGVFVFAVLLMIMHYIPLSSNLLMMIVMVVCIFAMVYKMEDKLQMTIFTTVMSVMVSLMYITPPEAMVLKILWVVVASVVVSIINYGFLPYSVEKETKNNFKASFELNEQSINLIKAKCQNKTADNKTTIMVMSNVIHENIEVTDENRELYMLQEQITDISNFIISYMDIYDFSNIFKEKLIGLIENSKFSESDDDYENVILYSTSFVVGLFEDEKRLIRGFD